MTAAADTATVSLPDGLGSAAREFLARPRHLLIGSERFEAADGRTFATLDPATGREIAQVAHAVVAILFVALILAHIYIGTLGMEGAFEAMGTGEVDLNWAKEHHDLWLARQLASENRQTEPSATPAE